MSKKEGSHKEKDKIANELKDFDWKECEANKIFEAKGFKTADLIKSFYQKFHEEYPMFEIERKEKRSKGVLIKFFQQHLEEMKKVIKNFSVVIDDEIVDKNIRNIVENENYTQANPDATNPK